MSVELFYRIKTRGSRTRPSYEVLTLAKMVLLLFNNVSNSFR